MDFRTTRRTILAAGAAAGALPLLPRWAAAAGVQTGSPVPFSFDALRDTARELAEAPFAPAAVEDAELLEFDRL